MTRAEQIKKEMAAKAAAMKKTGDASRIMQDKPTSKDPKGLYEAKKKKKKKVRFDASGNKVTKRRPTANKTASEKAREAMNQRRKLGEK